MLLFPGSLSAETMAWPGRLNSKTAMGCCLRKSNTSARAVMCDWPLPPITIFACPTGRKISSGAESTAGEATGKGVAAPLEVGFKICFRGLVRYLLD